MSAFLGGALHGGIDHVDAGKLENADEENEHEGENEGGFGDFGGGAIVPDAVNSGEFHRSFPGSNNIKNGGVEIAVSHPLSQSA